MHDKNQVTPLVVLNEVTSWKRMIERQKLMD